MTALLRLPATALLALAAAGCAQPGGAVRVVSADTGAIALDAGGRSVVVRPPAGDCLDVRGVHLHQQAAVTRLSPCDGAADGASQIITIGSAPLFGAASTAQELAALEAHLRGPQGRAGLGLVEGDPVRIVASRRQESALYLVLESAGAPNGLLCRAFTQVNGRMAMVSATAETGDAADLVARAEAIVTALREANPQGVAPDVPPSPRPAGGAPAPRPARV